MRQLVLLAALSLPCAVNAQHLSDDFTQRWQVYAHQLLRESIPYRTVRGEDQVLPFAQFLAQAFLDHGFAESDVRILPMPSEDVASASLVVRYAGSSDSKPILFIGHLDVVPAGAEDWGRDPFELTEEDGYFYGRGVIDNKFATTVLTTTFLRLKQAGFKPERDLVIAFTGDEETKQEDIKTLLREHRKMLDAEFAIVVDSSPGFLDDTGKPAALFQQYAEKNYLSFEITARAPGGHSSQPSPDNSIYKLAGAINAIENLTFPVQTDAENRAFFGAMGNVLGGDVGSAMRRFGADATDTDAIAVLAGTPGVANRLGTTCVPTMLRGGSAENALPEEVTVTVNCRVYPGVSSDAVQARLENAINDAEIEFTRTWDPLPAVASPIRPDVTQLLLSVIRTTLPEVPLVPMIASGTTDGKFLRIAGIDAYGVMSFFIRPGEYKAHGSGERLPVNGFFESLDFWEQLVRAAGNF